MIHSELLNRRIDITKKVLSFYLKSTIVLLKKYYRFT